MAHNSSEVTRRNTVLTTVAVAHHATGEDLFRFVIFTPVAYKAFKTPPREVLNEMGKLPKSLDLVLYGLGMYQIYLLV